MSTDYDIAVVGGGLAGATCYDEILCPSHLAPAAEEAAADAILLVGPDWPFVDPELCAREEPRHLRATKNCRTTQRSRFAERETGTRLKKPPEKH